MCQYPIVPAEGCNIQVARTASVNSSKAFGLTFKSSKENLSLRCKFKVTVRFIHEKSGIRVSSSRQRKHPKRSGNEPILNIQKDGRTVRNKQFTFPKSSPSGRL